MSALEILIFLVLLFMGAPDLCRKLGRPALAYPAFVLFGRLLLPQPDDRGAGRLHAAGKSAVAPRAV